MQEGRNVRELEFLPSEYLWARFHRRVRFLRSWLLLALALAMVLWSLQVGFWVQDAQAELAALCGTGDAVDADVAKVRMLRAEGQLYSRRIEAVALLRPRVMATDLLAALADLLPDGVVADDVTVDHSPRGRPEQARIRLAGVAPTETAVAQVLAAMEASPAFEGTVLVESKPALAGDRAGARAFIVAADARIAPPAKE
jgi:Tfp pilus assembly protein PilN